MNVAHQCKQGSVDGTLTFPDVVVRLQSAGIERYVVDLTRLRTTYYGDHGDAQDEALPLSDLPAIAWSFDEVAVKDALRASQRGAIRYPEFVRRTMAAGLASYTVFIHGRKVVYTGRHGDAYVETFPATIPEGAARSV